jgi:hypothetical protein
LKSQGSPSGGGIFSYEHGTILTHVTVANNTGGGIESHYGLVSSKSSIFADNGPQQNCSGSLSSQGHNLSDDATCFAPGGTDRTGVDPNLDELKYNGGPTKTLALLDKSPAIDAADNTNAPAFDQRGVSRPQDGDGNGQAFHDIGAFEKVVNKPPELMLPDGIIEEATSKDGAEITYTVTATDPEDVPLTPNCSRSSGSTFAMGTTQVNCSVTDSGGLSASGSFDVTVRDTTAPELTVPSNTIVVEATDASGTTVNFADGVNASDKVDPNPSIECAPASGSTFALGTTQVRCTAKDASGNQSAAKPFDVKVQDTTAPVISDMPSDIAEETTSSAGTVVNYTKPTANDAVDPSPVVTCSPDPGSTFPVGSTSVSCTAKDATGNESAAETFKVNVLNANVAYEWSGFLQPINTPANMAPSPYAQSIFKLGSTVPVKFKLTGASAGITNGNFYLKYIRTGNGDGVGEIEVVATAAGNTGTQFRYDATTGQYIFNWSTKGISASQAGNYEVRVDTDSAFTNLLGSQSIELKK